MAFGDLTYLYKSTKSSDKIQCEKCKKMIDYIFGKTNFYESTANNNMIDTPDIQTMDTSKLTQIITQVQVNDESKDQRRQRILAQVFNTNDEMVDENKINTGKLEATTTPKDDDEKLVTKIEKITEPDVVIKPPTKDKTQVSQNLSNMTSIVRNDFVDQKKDGDSRRPPVDLDIETAITNISKECLNHLPDHIDSRIIREMRILGIIKDIDNKVQEGPSTKITSGMMENNTTSSNTIHEIVENKSDIVLSRKINKKDGKICKKDKVLEKSIKSTEISKPSEPELVQSHKDLNKLEPAFQPRITDKDILCDYHNENMVVRYFEDLVPISRERLITFKLKSEIEEAKTLDNVVEKTKSQNKESDLSQEVLKNVLQSKTPNMSTLLAPTPQSITINQNKTQNTPLNISNYIQETEATNPTLQKHQILSEQNSFQSPQVQNENTEQNNQRKKTSNYNPNKTGLDKNIHLENFGNPPLEAKPQPILENTSNSTNHVDRVKKNMSYPQNIQQPIKNDPLNNLKNNMTNTINNKNVDDININTANGNNQNILNFNQNKKDARGSEAPAQHAQIAQDSNIDKTQIKENYNANHVNNNWQQTQFQMNNMANNIAKSLKDNMKLKEKTLKQASTNKKINENSTPPIPINTLVQDEPAIKIKVHIQKNDQNTNDNQQYPYGNAFQTMTFNYSTKGKTKITQHAQNDPQREEKENTIPNIPEDSIPKPEIKEDISKLLETKPKPTEKVSLQALLQKIRERNRKEYCQTKELKKHKVYGKCGDKKPPCPPPAPQCPPPPPPPECPKPCPQPGKTPPPPKNPCKCPCPPDPCKPKACFSDTHIKFAPNIKSALVTQHKTIECNNVVGDVFTLQDRKSYVHSFYNFIQVIMSQARQMFCYFIHSDNNLLLVRSFEPWSPIPSWPTPKKKCAKPFICPKEGCKRPPPPKLTDPCKHNPCINFPKKI